MESSLRITHLSKRPRKQLHRYLWEEANRYEKCRYRGRPPQPVNRARRGWGLGGLHSHQLLKGLSTSESEGCSRNSEPNKPGEQDADN